MKQCIVMRQSKALCDTYRCTLITVKYYAYCKDGDPVFHKNRNGMFQTDDVVLAAQVIRHLRMLLPDAILFLQPV